MMMVVVSLRYLWRIYTVLKYGPPATELEAIASVDEAKGEAFR
jgi:hypothetical protein